MTVAGRGPQETSAGSSGQPSWVCCHSAIPTAKNTVLIRCFHPFLGWLPPKLTSYRSKGINLTCFHSMSFTPINISSEPWEGRKFSVIILVFVNFFFFKSHVYYLDTTVYFRLYLHSTWFDGNLASIRWERAKIICNHLYSVNRLKNLCVIWFLKCQIFRNIFSTFCLKKKCALTQWLDFKTFLLFYCYFKYVLWPPAVYYEAVCRLQS